MEMTMPQQRDKEGNLPSNYVLPKTPDKGSEKSPTYYDWQSREIIAESKRDKAKKATKVGAKKLSK
jgi:hypothetical protein